MNWDYFVELVMQYGPALVGVVMPWFVTILNRNVVDSRIKFGVTLAACLAAAGLLKLDTLFVGQWSDAGEVLGLFSLLFTESQVVYRLFFKDSKQEAWLLKKIGAPDVA